MIPCCGIWWCLNVFLLFLNDKATWIVAGIDIPCIIIYIPTCEGFIDTSVPLLKLNVFRWYNAKSGLGIEKFGQHFYNVLLSLPTTISRQYQLIISFHMLVNFITYYEYFLEGTPFSYDRWCSYSQNIFFWCYINIWTFIKISFCW